MENIVKSGESKSKPFKIPSGKQITLFATGLSGDDYVEVLLVAITPAGPRGGICCPGPVVLPGLGSLYPLNRVCCDCEPVPVRLTAENPWFILREPQEVEMIVHVVADLEAVVEVSMSITEATGSHEQAPCPEVLCPPVTIAIDSITQNSAVVSITGGPATVSLGGMEQYGVGPFMFQGLEPAKFYVASALSDCGSKASTTVSTEAPPPCPAVTVTVSAVTQTSAVVAITGGPATVKVGADEQYGNGPFTFAGLAPNKFFTVMATNDCGARASTTLQTLATGDYCASIPSPWPSRGFLFHPNDTRDPAASVMVTYNGVQQGYGYPAPGAGHTTAVTDRDGSVLAYAANVSDCAPPCACEPIDICAEIARCPTNFVEFSNIGNAFGGGICFGAKVVNDPPESTLVVFQGRDKSFLTGGEYMQVEVPGAPNSSLQATITNRFEVPALLVAELIGHANNMVPGYTTGFAFSIGEDPDIPWPIYTGVGGLPIDPSKSFVSVDGMVPTGNVNGRPEDPDAPGFIRSGYQETAGPAKYVRMLAPGETITLYGQWWSSWVIGTGPGMMPPSFRNVALHGAMYFNYIMYRGGVTV